MNFPLNKAGCGLAGVDCHGACTRREAMERCWVDAVGRGFGIAWVEAQTLRWQVLGLSIEWDTSSGFDCEWPGAQPAIVHRQELRLSIAWDTSSGFYCKWAEAQLAIVHKQELKSPL